ncbi:hypothetical protein [Clostridium sp.]|uniref:hypothetical protein n=1 Tax=Clostridium sp. TaxID=1506 RepID=UPI0032174E23
MKVDIKKIKTSITILTYLVTFEYETAKGYRREQQRLVSVMERNDPKEVFESWVNKIRTIFNAEILGIVELKELKKIIEI